MPPLTLELPSMWVAACLTALVAGFVRGFAGFGGPAIMSLVLVQFYAPASVLSKVVLIDMVANLKLVPSTWAQRDRTVLWTVVLSSFCGMPIGLYALLNLDPGIMKNVIAGVCAVSSVVLLLGWRMKLPPGRSLLVGVGFVAGIALGATFIALPMVVFLLAAPGAAALARANFVQWAFLTSLVLIAVCIALGVLHADAIVRSAVVALFYFAGVVSGARLFRFTPERDYRRYVLWLLIALSAIAIVPR